MKFKVVTVIYNRAIHYTVAVNKGWRSLWQWKLLMLYRDTKEKADADLELCLKGEVMFD